MKTRLTLIGFLTANLLACGPHTEPQLSDAWIRLSPPGMQMTAGYLSITNPTAENRTLIRVSSPGFSRIEIHRTQIVDGKAKMVEQEMLVIPAGEKVSLEPGGLHLMLMDFENSLTENQSITLTLHWSNGTSSGVAAKISRQAP